MSLYRRLFFAVVVVLCLLSAIPSQPVQADWWQRPCIADRQDSRNPHPTLAPGSPANVHPDGGDCPTAAPQAAPSVTPAAANSGTGDNPCAPGKPFVGPYCGWSPSTDSGSSGGSSSGSSGDHIGGPAVLGLSDTAGVSTVGPDILLLLGVLCLLLYVRSKLPAAAVTAAKRRRVGNGKQSVLRRSV